MEKRKHFLITVAYFTVIVLLVYVGFKLLPYIFPFIIGFLCAKAVIPASLLVTKRTHIPEKISRSLCLTLFLAVVLLIAAFISAFLASGLSGLISTLPDFFSFLPQAIMNLYDKVMVLAEGISPELAFSIAETAASLTEGAAALPQELIIGALKYLYGIVTGVPSVLISIGATVISAYLFVIDMPRISEFVKASFPSVFSGVGNEIFNGTLKSLFGMLKAYVKLMLITLVELTIGFLIMKIPYPFTLALLVSVVDILPVLGVGTVLVPWGIVLLLLQKPVAAMGIFILYAVITVVRYILEPKIVSDHINLHPTVTLICIFLGLRLGGLLGMFILPIIAIAVTRYWSFTKNKVG